MGEFPTGLHWFLSQHDSHCLFGADLDSSAGFVLDNRGFSLLKKDWVIFS